LKLQQETREPLQDIGSDNDFLYRVTEAHETKAKLHNWGYIKLKSCNMAKETFISVKFLNMYINNINIK
jgi:hypothetical protein